MSTAVCMKFPPTVQTEISGETHVVIMGRADWLITRGPCVCSELDAG